MKNMKQFACGALIVFFFLMLCRIDSVMAAGEVEIFNQDSSQFEISDGISANIYVDIIDPSYIEHETNSKDILLITHAHPDHYDRDFADSFPGKSLVFKEGRLSFANGYAISIASTHTEQGEDKPLPENGSNYIVLVEVNGLRIAHFGDIGQIRFTEHQLKLLGRIDIAITQFINPLSQMSMENKKAFNLVNALSPSLVIPTHHGRFSEEVVKYAQTIWKVYASEEKSHIFSKEQLPKETTLLVWGDGASFLMDDFGLKQWPERK